jgi:metallo-beta-lactamase family protein
MSSGGRILHHEKRLLSDSKNMLLLVGYQAVGTLGRLIQDGAKEVTIHNETVPVKAEVRVIQGFSSHKDSDNLIDFIDKAQENSQNKLKKVFVAMGEPKSSLFLVQRLRDYIGVNAVSPERGEVVELEL